MAFGHNKRRKTPEIKSQMPTGGKGGDYMSRKSDFISKSDFFGFERRGNAEKLFRSVVEGLAALKYSTEHFKIPVLIRPGQTVSLGHLRLEAIRLCASCVGK